MHARLLWVSVRFFIDCGTVAEHRMHAGVRAQISTHTDVDMGLTAVCPALLSLGLIDLSVRLWDSVPELQKSHGGRFALRIPGASGRGVGGKPRIEEQGVGDRKLGVMLDSTITQPSATLQL